MDAEELDGTIKTRACEVVDALDGLTPYERALVWQEVELALDELTITTTATIAQREARKTPMRCWQHGWGPCCAVCRHQRASD